ncbi:MAG TPA: FAD-dependent monooxygenase [Methylophilus sp.]
MAQSIQTEVAVVGAGLVGMTAAIALAQLHRPVVLIDAKAAMTATTPEWDARVYALTEHTIAWLTAIGVWAHVDITRIQAIDAMQLWGHDSESALTLNAEDAHLMHMGCIIENQNLMVACWQALLATEVPMQTAACVKMVQSTDCAWLSLSNGATVQAQLILAADGAQSWVRQQAHVNTRLVPFDQIAIVANYAAAQAHHAVARQWFDAHETLALLPLPQQLVSMVWALPTARATALLSLAPQALADQVALRSQHLLGDLKPVGQTLSFMLNQQTAQQFIAQRVVFMGDAAHQVHPMAGQGVNLGFKDVIKLCELAIKLNRLQDIGDAGFLRQYERARKLDVLAMNGLTSGLDTLFASQQSSLKQVTRWGMQWLNKSHVVKQYLIQQATL